MYATINEYISYFDLSTTDYDAAEIEKSLEAASRDIDTLTFNRIRAFDRLTEFQQGIVKEVCLRLTEFKIENADILQSPIKSYSVNGVSMSFDDVSIKQVSGVYIPSDLYSLLRQTGLMCGVL